MIERRQFNAGDLTLIEETGHEVVLASGGPIMVLVAIEGDNGLCAMRHDKSKMNLFPLVCLRRLLRLTSNDFKELRE